MRRFGVLVGAVAVMMAIGVSSAAAFEGGGRAPSEAPLITYGQHYTATLDNRKEDANYSGRDAVALYKIPSLATHDQLVVNWHELPFAHSSSFPVCMLFVQGLNDFNWGTIFSTTTYGDCDESSYRVSGSGTAQTVITVQNADVNSYLEFFSEGGQTESTRFETYPYDFSVEAPRHYLGVALGAVQKVAANGVLHAAATLATGAPVPDGLPFALTATWSGGGTFTTTAASAGGQLTFPLALPETAYKHSVEFVVSSPATAEYQAATSPKLTVEVTKPKVVVEPNLCAKATNKARTLARQYRRQLKNADRSRGRARHRLFHQAHATGRKFNAAKAAAKAVC